MSRSFPEGRYNENIESYLQNGKFTDKHPAIQNQIQIYKNDIINAQKALNLERDKHLNLEHDQVLSQCDVVKMIEKAVQYTPINLILRNHIYTWVADRQRKYQHPDIGICDGPKFFNIELIESGGTWKLNDQVGNISAASIYRYRDILKCPGAAIPLRFALTSPNYREILSIMHQSSEYIDIMQRPWIINPGATEILLQYLLMAQYYLHFLEVIKKTTSETTPCTGISYINLTLVAPKMSHIVALIIDRRPTRVKKSGDQGSFSIEYFDPYGYGSKNTDYINIKNIVLSFLNSPPFNFTGTFVNIDEIMSRQNRNLGHAGIQMGAQSTIVQTGFDHNICALYTTWYIVQRALNPDPAEDVSKYMSYFYIDGAHNHYLILGFALNIMRAITFVDYQRAETEPKKYTDRLPGMQSRVNRLHRISPGEYTQHYHEYLNGLNLDQKKRHTDDIDNIRRFYGKPFSMYDELIKDWIIEDKNLDAEQNFYTKIDRISDDVQNYIKAVINNDGDDSGTVDIDPTAPDKSGVYMLGGPFLLVIQVLIQNCSNIILTAKQCHMIIDALITHYQKLGNHKHANKIFGVYSPAFKTQNFGTVADMFNLLIQQENNGIHSNIKIIPK